MNQNGSKTLSSAHNALLKDVLESHGVIVKCIYTQAVCKASDNYSSEIISVKIKTVNEDELLLIVKASTTNNTLEEITAFNNVIFKNEITMYTKVLKEFKEIQMTLAKIKYIFKSAKFYGGSTEIGKEIIILENLNEDGYNMLDKLMPLSNDTIKITIKNLAQFHSFSYALKVNSPEKYFNFCKSLVDTNSLNDVNQQENGFWNLGYYFSEIFDCIKYKNIVINSFGKHIARINALNACDKDSKYFVIIHGDCWVNNILFKFKDNLPQQCLLIDYQLSKESSPVEDILHLIFNSTDYETRTKYYYHWIDFYYSELQKHLLNLNLDINIIYPRAKFNAHIKKYAKVHLGMAIIKLCFILRENEESQDLKDALLGSEDMESLISYLKTSVATDKTTMRIKNRIEELIDSCKEFGYLKRKKKRKALKKKKKIRLLQRKNIANLKSD